MRDSSDMELVGEFARHHAEAAFAELVQRHVNLVYSVAFRHIANAAQAEEITQTVFVTLARKAAGLPPDTVLAAWLYETARLTAISFLRGERRRQFREQEAYMQSTLEATSTDPAWQQLAPLLDDGMMWLARKDREAVVLRFFQDKDLREVAAALNINEAAAQKRVQRAVEKLRTFFTKRGVVLPAAALTAAISANAVQAAPVGLAVTILSAATIAGTTVAATATATATKVIAMTTLQKTIIGATLAVAVGTGIYEAREASNARAAVETLRQQHAPLNEQIQQLQRERDEAKDRLATVAAEIARVKGNSEELLKLRGLVARLRGETSQMNDPFVQTALGWQRKKERILKFFAEHPDQRIPEMQLLTEWQWLEIANKADVNSEEGLNTAPLIVRNVAMQLSSQILQQGLKKFMDANNGEFPVELAQLKPYFNPPLDDAILQRYELLDKNAKREAWQEGVVILEKAVINKVCESPWAIGPDIRITKPREIKQVTFPRELVPALEAYQAKFPRSVPGDYNELRPYLSTPEQLAALEKMIREWDAISRGE